VEGSAATNSIPAAARLPNGLPAELSRSLVTLWTHYAGKPPTNARTEIRGNVVTCVLMNAVADFTPAAYKRAAVAAVARLTRQRVASFVSSHDRDTDVATEVFTLEASLRRGAPPLAERRLATRNGEDGNSKG
jgi:hypothetical protein